MRSPPVPSGRAAPLGISAVLVTRDRRPLLVRALERLEACSTLIDEVLVVDNGSTDGTVAALQGRFPGLRLIPLAQNVGVPRARNLGARRARYDLLLFLDDDGALEPRGLPQLAWRLRSEERLAGVGLSVVEVSDLAFPPEGQAERVDRPPRVHPARTFYGGAALLKRAPFEAAGGYAGELFYSHEEDDLALRWWKQGYWVARCKTVRYLHLGVGRGEPRGPRLYHYYRNRQRVIWRHLPWRAAVQESLWTLGGGLARTLLTRHLGACARGSVRGGLEGVRERRDPLTPERYRAYRRHSGEEFGYVRRLRRLGRQLWQGKRLDWI